MLRRILDLKYVFDGVHIEKNPHHPQLCLNSSILIVIFPSLIMVFSDELFSDNLLLIESSSEDFNKSHLTRF